MNILKWISILHEGDLKMYRVLYRKNLVLCLLCLFAGIPAVNLADTGYSIFGVRGKGASVYFILDAGPSMMKTSLGGASGYGLKKHALLDSINTLPPSTKFNVAVYSEADTHILFPEMVPATEVNRMTVHEWLKPLNSNKSNGKHGVETLGEGGVKNIDDDVWVAPFNVRNHKLDRPWEEMNPWFRPAMLAVRAQASSIFLFTSDWATHTYKLHFVHTENCWYPVWIFSRSDI